MYRAAAGRRLCAQARGGGLGASDSRLCVGSAQLRSRMRQHAPRSAPATAPAGTQHAPGGAAKATWWPCCGAGGCVAAAFAAPSSALALLPRSRTPRSLASTMESTRGSRREVLAGGTQPTLRKAPGQLSTEPIFRNTWRRAAAAAGRTCQRLRTPSALLLGAARARDGRARLHGRPGASGVPPVCTVIARPAVRSLLRLRDGRGAGCRSRRAGGALGCVARCAGAWPRSRRALRRCAR